jgi:alkylated DNA repair protein alkB family protein 8
MCQPSTSTSARYHRVDRDGEQEVFYKYVRPSSKKTAGHAGTTTTTQHLFVSGSKRWIRDLHEAISSGDEATRIKNATYVSQLVNDAHFYLSFPTVEDAGVAAATIAALNDDWLAPRFEAWRMEVSEKDEEAFRDMDPAEADRLRKKRDRQPRIVTQYAEMHRVTVKNGRGVSDNCSAFVAAECFGEAATEPATHERVCGIEGLTLVVGFVTDEEASALLDVIDENDAWDQMARRRVKHFGKKFSYVKRTVDLDDSDVSDIPLAIRDLVLDRVASYDGLEMRPGDFVGFDQVTVNEYQPGVGLSPHVDTHSAFGDTIISLSLHCGTVMVFRRSGRHPRAVYLPPRSLLIMSGEARWAWEHYIPHRKSDVLTDGKTVTRRGRRVSLTCRTVRSPDSPCACPFPEVCDSQLAIIPPTRHMLEGGDGNSPQRADRGADSRTGPKPGRSPAGQLEQSVNEVYNAIAPHFSATRFAIWPKIRQFIESIPPHALVADVGCGNGKYFGVRDDLFVTGTDRSEGLVRVARMRLDDVRADVAICDGCRLAYRPCIDAVICIAVIHHLASVSQRITLIESIGAALRPGGRAFLTAWATDQEDQDKVKKWIRIQRTDDDPDSSDNDFYVPWHLPIHRAEREAVDMSVGDVNESKGTVMFKRYIHLYEEGEIERLVGKARGVAVVGSAFDKDNWCVEIERTMG